jgi:hypothetical protein
METKHAANFDELAVVLFREFARMEYALKATGFHNGDGDAKADWDGFAKKFSSSLMSDGAISSAVMYMKDHPPKKQVIENGKLGWDPVTPQPIQAVELLRCVRRVRNNLFHGGKSPEYLFEPERDEQLLRHSLSILDACLRLSPEVKNAFDG